jgi:hypothetical protein
MALSRPMAAAPMFLCISTNIEAAGMKTLVKGQLPTYDTAPARDGA